MDRMNLIALSLFGLRRSRRSRNRVFKSIFSRQTASPKTATASAETKKSTTPKARKQMNKIVSPKRNASRVMAKALMTVLSSPRSTRSANLSPKIVFPSSAQEDAIVSPGRSENDVAVATVMALVNGNKHCSLKSLKRGSRARPSVSALKKSKAVNERGLSHYGAVSWAEKTFDLSDSSLRGKSLKSTSLFEKIEVETDKLSPWDTARCDQPCY